MSILREMEEENAVDYERHIELWKQFLLTLYNMVGKIEHLLRSNFSTGLAILPRTF